MTAFKSTEMNANFQVVTTSLKCSWSSQEEMHIYLDSCKLFWQMRLPTQLTGSEVKEQQTKESDHCLVSHRHDHHMAAQQHFLNGTFSD